MGPSETKPGIRVSAISKSYHHFSVLNDVSFEVGAGECFALFGRNGAGKTTLLKILATLQPPSSGGFEIGGFDGIRDRTRARERLMLIAHGSFLYEDLDAGENIRFAMALRGMSPTDREIKIALDRVGIGAFSEFKIRAFSEGMKKRLSIAKAILIRPGILLMDEPYSSLDEHGMKMVNDFIRAMTKQGTSVFMTSHNRAQSAEVTQRAGVLHQGGMKEMTIEALAGADEIF